MANLLSSSLPLTMAVAFLMSDLSYSLTTLRVDIFQMPRQVELSSVTTAGHYILATHLVRTLTKLDRFGKIQGELAKKWFCSNDRKTWNIVLYEAKFSNGEPITASDVVASIQKQKLLGTGVHFPFEEIKSVKTIDRSTLEIVLVGPRNDFIFELAKPEFGVLYKTDVESKKNESRFAVTSGPYFLDRHESDTYYLRRNKNYSSDVSNELDLIMASSDGGESGKKLVKGEIQFFTTQQNLNEDEHRKMISNISVKTVKPHVGFSFWLSINTESKYFQNPSHRAHLQILAKKYHSEILNGNFWEKADQLYLPDGDGRPSSHDLDEIWDSINARDKVHESTKPKLRVLPLKIDNQLTIDILEYLKNFYQIKILKYSSEDELIKLIKDGHFDLKISSNDFSSVDLYENLKTTFNASRPYVFLGRDKEISKWMKDAGKVESREERSQFFKKIGVSLLKNGFIAPLAYLRVWFYHSEHIDISSWSHLFPEISIWKVKIKK